MIQAHLNRKALFVCFGLIVLIIATSVIAIATGYASIPANRILPTILGKGDFSESFVLLDIRLPRIIITLLSGMALALSGAILQSLSRNDLADPGIIGINSGAGVAVAVFFLFSPIEVESFAYILPIAAFLGGLVTAFLIYIFAYEKRTGLHPTKLVLVGIGFSMALGGVMIVLMSASKSEKVDFIAKWLSGSIWGADWPFIWIFLPWLVILIPFALYKSQILNLLTLSGESSKGIGVSIEKERILLLLTAVALAATAVSVSGSIAFVGLIAPHMAKSLVGPRHQRHLPVAILIGGWFLLLADTIGRNIGGSGGIPAGIVVAIIGGPYFIYLLIRKK